MMVPISRIARGLSLVLATESLAFVLQSFHPRTSSRSQVAQSVGLRVQHERACGIPRRPCSRGSFPCRRGALSSFLLTVPLMLAESEEGVEDVRVKGIHTGSKVLAADIAQHQDGGEGTDATADNNLEAAFGAGKGKHAGKKRRRHSNKYSSKSKTAEIDPWEEQLQQASKTVGEAEARSRKEMKELEERRVQRRIERGEVDYPDEEDIDPYDPSTFGYIEVGQIQGAHGIKGEVKVRSCSDFAMKRLCTAGVKYIKAPNRRFPRDVELVGGRWQKDEIFLLQFEGIGTRDAAAALRGHKVYVLEDEEVDLEENEYMVRDLVGARAYRMDNESVYLGEVVGVVLGDDLSSTIGLASDMLELRLPLDKPTDVPKQCYIPFVPALVPVVRVNGENSTVLMDLPDGLLDLAEEVEEKVVIKGLLEG